MRTNLILFILLISFSCKSTKKALVENRRVEEDIISVSTNEISKDLGNVTKNTIITEVTTQKYEPVGDVLKPVTTTTKTIEIIEVESKNATTKKAIEVDSIELSSFDSLNLNRETEGMEVVEEIVGGITGAFVGDIVQYIIGSIFFIVLLIVVRKFFKSRGV